MTIIHGNMNDGSKSEQELDKLRTDLRALGLPETTINAQLSRFEKPNNNEIPILRIIKHEFDFFLIHVYDLFNDVVFDWSGLDIKMKYLNPPNINKEHLTYVIEGYRNFLLQRK